jgi:hypothetical protein
MVTGRARLHCADFAQDPFKFPGHKVVGTDEPLDGLDLLVLVPMQTRPTHQRITGHERFGTVAVHTVVHRGTRLECDPNHPRRVPVV